MNKCWCWSGIFSEAVALGLPIFLSLALSTAVYALVFPVIHSVVMAQTLVSGLNKPELTAIPFYLPLGAVMNVGGISQHLLRLATAMYGWCRGGLAHVNIGSLIPPSIPLVLFGVFNKA